MDKKLIGIITTAISMIAVLIFLILGFFWNLWGKAWIVFVVAGIAIALVSMIGNYTREKKENEQKTDSQDR